MAHQNVFGIVAAWALLVATMHGQGNVLAEVPDNALGVVVIHRLETTSANFGKLARALEIPVGSPLDMIKGISGVGQGIDETGSAAFVALPGPNPDGPPIGALLVPVTDYSAVIKQLKGNDAEEITEVEAGRMLVGRKGDYAVIAQPGNKAAVRQILDSKASLADSFPKALAEWQNEFGVVAIATPSGIKTLMSHAITGIERTKNFFPPDRKETQMVGQAFDLYAALFKDVRDNANYVAVGGRLDGQGALHLSSRTLLNAKPALLEKFAKAGSPTELLSALPTKNSFLAFAGPMPEEWLAGQNSFTMQAMKMNPLFSKLDEAQTKRLQEAMRDSMRGLDNVAMTVTSGGEIESIYERVLAIMKVADSNAFLKNYRQSINKLDELLSEVGDGSTKLYEIRDVEIDGKRALLLRMDAKAMMAGEPAIANPITEKLFGPEGKLDAYLAAADEKTVVMAYVSEAALKNAVAAYRSSKGAGQIDPLINQTAALLPEGAQWVGFLSPGGMVEFVRGMIGSIAPQGREIVIPEFPVTPPVGFAAKLSSETLDTDLVIPADVISAIGKYVQKVRAAHQQ